MLDQCMFVPDGKSFQPTEWAVGPWSPDLLQGSAYGGLLVRALERHAAAAGMTLARVSFDFWRPVTRELLTPMVTVLRDGRKVRTVEAALLQAETPVARCTGVFLRSDPAAGPPRPPEAAPAVGPEAARPVPPHVRAWSPFFTGVDTRVAEGDLLKSGPATAWFQLVRPLVAGEENSPLVHAVSAADLAGGISAVAERTRWTFVNPDLTVVFWRVPRPPWILLAAETHVGDQGTGVARGRLSDLDGPFGGCEATLIFERAR
ncbi:MAG TPA: thioesterase family protein [Methylomirabilota bacterium]|jgi:hypothetical protein